MRHRQTEAKGGVPKTQISPIALRRTSYGDMPCRQEFIPPIEEDSDTRVSFTKVPLRGGSFCDLRIRKV